jgi:hypothetical protein
MSFPRIVEPEWLDSLPAEDRRACRSRQDLRRLNRIMNHVGLIKRAIEAHWPRSTNAAGTAAAAETPRIVELGSGDGSLMLRIANRAAYRKGPDRLGPAELSLVDRQAAMTERDLQRFTALGWNAHRVVADVFDWLASDTWRADIIICNLFLHHFEAAQLSELLSLIARRSKVLIACEPARTRLAYAGSNLLGLIGCNDVTRHDAVVSVAAGFAGHELSALWPLRTGWQLQEGRAGLFSHSFIASAQT